MSSVGFTYSTKKTPDVRFIRGCQHMKLGLMHYPNVIGTFRIVSCLLLATCAVASEHMLVANAFLNNHTKVVRSVLGDINGVLPAIALYA